MATMKTSDDVLAEMVETLECPVCLNTIWKPPIYHCEHGHIFCGDCHGKLRGEGKDCPVCRQRLQGTRAFVVEQMVSKLGTHRCQNSGCDYLAPLAGILESHKSSCQFRPIECYFCSARVAIKDLPNHLKNHEQCNEVIQGKDQLTTAYVMKTTGYHPFSCTHVEGINRATSARFLFCRLLSDQRYMFWVSHFHDKNNTEGYKYTISILSGEKKDQGKTFRLVTYTGLCTPMDKSLNSIKQDQMCLCVPESFITSALDKNSNYWCEMKVEVAD